METLINEALMLISTVIVLPIVAVLTYAFFAGRLTNTENAKYAVLIEEDEEYWDAPDAKVPAAPNSTVVRTHSIEGGASA